MYYKYLTENTVCRIDDDGKSRVSCMVDNLIFQKWLSEGNVPEPADPPIEPSYKEKRLAEYKIDAPLGDVIDAILKVIAIPPGSELETIEAKRQVIKAKYPAS